MSKTPIQRGEILKIYTDGAARGNPGPAAYAFIFVYNDDIIHKEYDFCWSYYFLSLYKSKYILIVIYELIGLKYSITEILKEYPHLDRDIILHLLKIGKDANENLINVDIDEIISKED